MQLLTELKNLARKTPMGKRAIARKRIYSLVDFCRLSPEEIRQGEADPAKMQELVDRQVRKHAKIGKELNDRLDELETSPFLKAGTDVKSMRTKILFNYFAYGYTPNEYLVYDLEHISPEERAAYVSDRESVRYAYRFNDISSILLFRDKRATYKALQPYFHRQAIPIRSEADYERFLKYIRKHPVFVKKSAKESCGRGVELIDANGKNERELFEAIVSEGDVLLEERIAQSKALCAINASTVNTVRVQTMRTRDGIEIVWTFAKLGRAGFFIDNGAAGGLLAGIDMKTGIMNTDAVDEFGHQYKTHPDSGLVIKGFAYPDWEALISMCREMSASLPDAKWIGWDVAHTEKGWVVVEGNGVTETIGPQSVYQTGVRRKLDELAKRTESLF